jgi:hypothetical protein
MTGKNGVIFKSLNICVTYNWAQSGRVFIPCRSFLFNQTFAGKDRRLPKSGAPGIEQKR